MSSLKEYLSSKPYKRFPRSEWSEPLLLIYKVLGWMVRDQADTLIITPRRFIWRKQNKIVGELDTKGIKPEPSYEELLKIVIQRDEVIRASLKEVTSSPDELVYRIAVD